MSSKEPSGLESTDPEVGRSRREFLARTLGGAVALGGAAELLTGCGSSGPRSTTSGGGSAQVPKRGGQLVAGLSGGTSADTLDALTGGTTIDAARIAQLYDQLSVLAEDGSVAYRLAEEITPNRDGSQWTIRLRPGVTFHNGRELTADDVIYTFHMILTTQTDATVALSPVDKNQLRKLDKLTVRVGCEGRFATFAQTLASCYALGIIPVGYDPRKPVGTGPFMYESFTPGTQSTFTRNPNYWEEGLPYVDRLVINNFADEVAQMDALQAGEVDCIDQLSSATLAALQGGSSTRALISTGGGFNPFTMRVDVSPFDDVRVREAFRLVVNRAEMRTVVFSGHGLVANDLWSPWDPYYDRSLPQREQDIDQAKSLLKQAGRSGLSVELVTADIGQGVVSMAQVFARQASEAGINVQIRVVTPTELYGPNYTKWPFSQDYWYYMQYFPQVALSMLPGAPWNETHWSAPNYLRLYQDALTTLDTDKQRAIAAEMQRIDYSSGAYIIPVFPPVIDGVSTELAGVHEAKTGVSLGGYDFKRMWLT